MSQWFYVYYYRTDSFGSSLTIPKDIAFMSNSQELAEEYCRQANALCKGNPFYWVEGY